MGGAKSLMQNYVYVNLSGRSFQAAFSVDLKLLIDLLSVNEEKMLFRVEKMYMSYVLFCSVLLRFYIYAYEF